MKRGELWIGSATADFAKKPRPHLIVQANPYCSDEAESVVICPLTSFIQPQIRYRVILNPNLNNGLEQPSQLMIDKITHLNLQKLSAVHLTILDYTSFT
ncbi:MAG: type II toxin-antitoxin system PemK/MazF family toxin [Candidatus Pacebacteria bacterium]|nr:type II toxin-antitoxin system PemK/MazF family toxin [Candidatus Paceibacterota bacterium]